MTSLAEALRPVVSAEPPEKAELMFGTADPATLAERLARFCEAALGESPGKLVFAGGFVAGVFGFEMPSGTRAVVKLHQPGTPLPHLKRAYELQEKLRKNGFPCAAILAAPAEVAPDMYAVAHAFFTPGKEEDCGTPAHRAELARALHGIVSGLKGESPEGLRTYSLKEIPRTDGVGSRLAAIQNQALSDIRRANQNPVIAHTDIKGRNSHFEHGRISAIYDFDSLSVISEAQVVGSSAVDFMSGRGEFKINLDPRIALGYVREYESHRKKPFTNKEMEIVRAGAVLGLVRLGRFFLDHPAGISESRLAGAIEDYKRAAQALFR